MVSDRKASVHPARDRFRAVAFLIGALAVMAGAAPALSQVQIQQRPLTLGSDVPNNLALVPSVEYPTLISYANFFGTTAAQLDAYDPSYESVGYFDSNKCYKYVYAAEEAKRHFEPVALAKKGFGCVAADKQWSGNFLNWVGTQTIDPFRKALTGGYRVVDTPTETWLEKADFHVSFRPTDPYIYYRSLSPSNTSMPAAGGERAWFRIVGNGNQLVFGFDGGNFPGAPTPYDPAIHALNGVGTGGARPDNRLYTLSMRVQVCVDKGAVKPEPNCQKYGDNYKPEGLIQKYSDRMRYSVFAYLNDSRAERDGGVMRARQKYVGPLSYDPVQGVKDNPVREWNPDTGEFYSNPDPADSASTNVEAGAKVVVNSGVINYINKFGQTTPYAPKGLDPVSELFYTALRYFKKQGNVASYSWINPANADQWTDRFPVVTKWDDPIQYTCQRNVAISIGDVNTWNDRNLPGSTNRPAEPGMPAEVSADTSVNVETDYSNLSRLEKLEGITLPAANAIFSGRNNSAFLAALAYGAHTRDLRSDLDGMQTLSSFWVDVAEGKVVQGRASNQYYLAAKYGGFDVPIGFNPDSRNTILPEAWWVGTDKTGKEEFVGVGGLADAKRPRNFFIANRAEAMIEGLNRAFKAAAEQPRRGAAATVGTNGASVQEGAMVYVPTYYTDWSGELSAYAVDPITKSLLPRWNASNKVPAPAGRKIYANSNGYGAFTWSRLDSGDRKNIGSEDAFDYLRGDRSKEIRNGGGLRDRGNVLGDFVNSSPLYVGAPSPMLYADSGFTGGGQSYVRFASAQATRAGTVYIGGNDGMLHGFNAQTGEEIYAFVPAAALRIPNGFADYVKPEYSDNHRYFVDGELTAADVFINGQWRTVLVGTMGRGGRGVFALDITDPSAISFLWEKDEDQLPRLGNNLSKPTIVQTADGIWKVLLGNGPNSEGGAAQLLALDVATGAADAINTNVAGNNGLSGVRAWDADRDGFFESAYAGDLNGNLWKFSGLSEGATASATLVFQAQAGQAITATPLVGFRPDSVETWVYFGTGRFLGSIDVNDTSVQSWYGIIDSGKAVGRGDLVQRTIEYEGVIKNAQGREVAVRMISAAVEGDMKQKAGWYIDFVSPGPMARGERMVVPNLFDGSRLLGITRIPNGKNPCSPGGSGFTMEIDPFTGARLGRNVFDTNGDGKIDAGDNIGGGTGQPGSAPASGIGSKEAENGAVIVPGAPENIIVRTNDGGDTSATRTPVAGIGVKRVSWREVVRDVQ